MPMTQPGTSAQKLGQGAILLCAVLWSTSGLFIKLVDWNPPTIAGARSIIAALFLFALRRRKRTARPGADQTAARQTDGSAKKRGVPFAGDGFYVFAGGFAYAVTMITFVLANKLTSPANAILIQYSAPVWAAVLGWLIAGERPRGEHGAALLLVFLGLYLFFRDGIGGGNFTGDMIAVCSGIAFGAQSVFLRMIKKGNPADAMLVSQILTALFSLPFFFFYPPSLSAVSIMAVLFMGTIQIGAAAALFAWGIRRVTALTAMLTAAIEPVLNPLWVFAVTGEKPSLRAAAGGAIIIAAVIMSSIVSAWRRRS
ncbi:MAG: DMT family transporter [Spirochaetaceae bacterium]|nr:DMT family transporter [Spirochaetaceae bacterium]